MPWSDALRKPVSAIYALRASSLDAFEAAGNLKDADWNVSHPRVFTSTRPPDTSGVTPDMVGNQGLYGERSMGAAMASHVRLQQKYTLFEAHQFLRSMQRQAHAFLSTGRTRKHDQRSVHFFPLQYCAMLPEANALLRLGEGTTAGALWPARSMGRCRAAAAVCGH